MTLEKNRIKVFEAFAGYGSQKMALERLKKKHPEKFDYEVVGISEIDSHALDAYQAAHGDCPNFGDITEIDWSQVPDFDLFTWSFPCQDISAAGLQRGFQEGSGTRSSLCYEALRAIREKRPKYALMENVKALVQKKFMPEFNKLQHILEEMGYANFWRVLNAKNYGVAQNRERVFMVSILKTEDDPNPRYEFPKPIPLTKCIADYLEDNVDGTFSLSQERVDDCLAKLDENSVQRLLKAHPRTSQVRCLGNLLYPHCTGGSFAGLVYDPSGCSPTLTTPSGGCKGPYIVVRHKDE